jgi:simple sugar transport system permease protein
MSTTQPEEMSPAVEPPASIGSNRVLRFARRYGQQIAIVGVLVVVWTIFLVGAPETFSSRAIYAAYMSTIPFFAVIAIPLTLVIISGEIDLSFPSIMAMGMVAFLAVFLRTESVALALPFALAVGFLIGLSNGWLVVHLGIPSIVVTIGTQFFWRGAALVLMGGAGASLVAAKGTPLHTLMVGRLFGYVPHQMLWTVAIAIATWFLLNRYIFGAHIYLIGDNENSARLMGVNSSLTRMLVFAVVGMAAALGGSLSSMEVAYFWPTLGEGYLLRTLAPVFLGGTSVFGGTGTIFGTFIGCFVIGAVEAGIVAIGLTGFWTQLIYGVIIIGSVAIQGILNRRFGNS